MKFTDYPLSHLILSQLENMNFKKPTDIQFKAIPYILNGEDVMAVAQTGTGKTAAFVIPIVQRLLNNKSKGLWKVSEGSKRFKERNSSFKGRKV